MPATATAPAAIASPAVASAEENLTEPHAAPQNQTPTISGSPASSVAAGAEFTFAPVAIDADGDTLGFSIENRPQWATFDTATGRLVGTPSDGNVGSFADIRITVSDGKATTSLADFSLSVTAVREPEAAQGGTATLSWSAPTENTDGSPLTDLVGYRIRYGTQSDALTQEIAINTVGMTTYTVTDLAPATYYFAIKSVSKSGAESSLSDVASKTIG
jgi:hypothetical protein